MRLKFTNSLKLLQILILLQFVIRFSSGVNNAAASTTEKQDLEDTELIEEFLNGPGGKKNATETLTPKSNLGQGNSSEETEEKKWGICTCAKYYDCLVACESDANEGNGTVMTNGTKDGSQDGIVGVVDIQQGTNTTGVNGTEVVGNGCKHYFDVKCKELKNNATPPPSSAEATTEKPKEDETPGKVNLPSAGKDWRHRGCGQRNEKGVGLTMKGATGGESQFGEFPWTAAIAQEELVEFEGKNVTRKALVCSGSLIHPNVVLTAAHCVYPFAYSARKSKLRVRLGEWDTANSDEPFPYQDRKVKEVVIHEQLNRKGLFNDIALVILNKAVELAPNVDTVCLPSTDTQLEDYYGHSCFSSGWGKDNFGIEGRYQQIMKKVEVPLMSKKECQEELRKTRLTSRFVLHDSFICGGGQVGHDTCVGDGGSALVCKAVNSPSYMEFGIVSWGIGCGTETPAAYVNVQKFVPWILNQLHRRHFDSSFCTKFLH